MVNAFILCNLFENFRIIMQQTEKEALTARKYTSRLVVLLTEILQFSQTVVICFVFNMLNRS